ncbi:MAG: glycosyltransferase family 4 protein [Planctomycetota bacterium]
MTRVLYATELCPCPPDGGSRIRARSLIRSLALRYELHVLAGEGRPDERLAGLVRSWETWPALPRGTFGDKVRFLRGLLRPRPEWSAFLEERLRAVRPDAVWFDYGFWGQYEPIARAAGARTIMGTHNAQSELTRQECRALPFGRSRLSRRLRLAVERRHERRLFSRFDRIVSVSEEDRRSHARFAGDADSLLVPNYVWEDDYAPEGVSRADGLVIMTGDFTSFQNVRGAAWFLREVWGLVRRQAPGAFFELAGRGSMHLPDLAACPPCVLPVGAVPRMAANLQRAVVAVVPLLDGGGTRLKILEAIACGTPVVSTSLGAQGLSIPPEEGILIADAPADFAAAIVRLLRDPALCASLSAQALGILRRDHSDLANEARIRAAVEGPTAAGAA